MSDTKIFGEHLHGVGCNVTNCKYNGTHCGEGSTCCASKITVKNENAMRKAETFCSTFEPTATV